MMDFTPLLRLYAKRRRHQLDSINPLDAQQRQLRRLLNRARNTVFGKEHGFTHIRTVSDFQKQVPLRTYETFWQDYWQPTFPILQDVSWPGRIPFFALSSGTSSGTTKYIPCTHGMTRANIRAGLDVLSHHVGHHPTSHILAGKSLMLGGSLIGQEHAHGIFSSDLSGIAARCLPWWARTFYFPPRHIALIEDWHEKISQIAPLSSKTDIRVITGIPSWLLIFFQKQAQLMGSSHIKAIQLYPHLELLVHGGVNFAPYRQRFEDFIQYSKADLREVYPASEGFIATADQGPDDGLRLMIDNGLFFEFVPIHELDTHHPTRLWLQDVETDVPYALVVSSCAGLWSYIIGDTVKFINLKPPRLLVTGRTNFMLSGVGEHLIVEEIEKAIACAAKEIDTYIMDYTVGNLFLNQDTALSRHLYIVEFTSSFPDPIEYQRFLETLDHTLIQSNDDYRIYRSRGSLAFPQMWSVLPGSFEQWMVKRGKLGGQNKVPRIITDQALFTDLCHFMQERVHKDKDTTHKDI